jgi:hypothetical protein
VLHDDQNGDKNGEQKSSDGSPSGGASVQLFADGKSPNRAGSVKDEIISNESSGSLGDNRGSESDAVGGSDQNAAIGGGENESLS